MTHSLPTQPTIDVLHWALDLAKAPITRPMSRWVEDEIILPNGPLGGLQYRHRYHPVSRLLFGEIDSGRWSRIAVTAPTQNGKTLMAYVLPVLYHLFELKETVVIGLPDMKMANDKWSEDFLPVIESSNFAGLLPTSGEGSRGGAVKRGIKFRNGATLRFMTAGGGDKNRAAFTARTIAITETDGMDEAGEQSREADKITQIEARSRAFGDGKRVYLECTVSIERGRIWQEVKHGSDARIVRPCPYCHAWVSPEREHLLGWREAESEGDARDSTHWVCPKCVAVWSEADRREGWKHAKVLHRGQEIDERGVITGELPRTNTLGFRWSAIDNPFTTAQQLGAEEWRALRSANRDNADKEMRQFVWCLPYEPPDVEMTPLDVDAIQQRTEQYKRGIVPAWANAVTVGVDTGKRVLHWTAIASGPCGRMAVVDYAKSDVEADRLGVFRGLVEALSKLGEYYEHGWSTSDGRTMKPTQVWIDSGYHEHTDAVYSFCEVMNRNAERGKERYRPSKGYGEGQQRMGRYLAPEHKQRDVMAVGREMHVSIVKRNGKPLPGVWLVHLNSDYWKSELHQRLRQPVGEAGALSLFKASETFGHADYSAHLVAEKQVEKFVAGRGTVIVWERVDRNNHWLDSTYGALAAAAFVQNNVVKKRERVHLKDMASGNHSDDV